MKTMGSEYKIESKLVRRFLLRRFGAIANPDAIFTPGHLVDCYEDSHDTPLRRVALRDWIAFENCTIDWGYDDFAHLLCLDEIPGETWLTLLTDEGLLERCAYRFQRAEFPVFAQWYQNTYCMEFFQSADYILFDDSMTHVRLLHHEGVLFRN